VQRAVKTFVTAVPRPNQSIDERGARDRLAGQHRIVPDRGEHLVEYFGRA
jgi:hypothetical protein